jgi:hypothetical protein
MPDCLSSIVCSAHDVSSEVSHQPYSHSTQLRYAPIQDQHEKVLIDLS